MFARSLEKPEKRSYRRLLLAASVLFISKSAYAQLYPPLVRPNFTQVAPQGFGDRQNSWAWGMVWFKNKLLVSTNRSYHCMEIAAIHRGFPLVPYPPNDKDMECAQDPADLPGQAEIWSYDPTTSVWTRVFQSPKDVPILTSPGKFAARDTGFRGMFVFKEPDGTEAVYASGLNARWYIDTEPPARILRSVDGVNFAPLPQDPGTVLADSNNNSFRGMTAHNGRLYVIAGNILGQGVVLGSSDPKLGNNAWQVVSAPGVSVFEVATFNGYLYFGTHNDAGFDVLKTSATGTPPYSYTTVLRLGGDRTDRLGNIDVISMHVFKGRLYVGGNAMNNFRGGELYRINPDDSWDLVSGHAHLTGQGFKSPLSGMLSGFSWPLNEHIWRMTTFDDRLYIGTFDMSTVAKQIPVLSGLLEPRMGFDLVQTTDGVYFSEVDRQGFQDKFNFGIRTFQPTPYGLFLGTANYYYGLQIWKGTPLGFPAPVATPLRVDVENQGTKNLLNWDPPASTISFRILRSQPVQVDVSALLRTAELPTALDTFYGTKNPLIPSMLTEWASGVLPIGIPGPFTQIAVTDKSYFADTVPAPGQTYYYIIRGINTAGQLSVPSNFVQSPSTVSMLTFRNLTDMVMRLNMRKKFTNTTTYNYVNTALNQAKAALPSNDLTVLTTLVQNLKANNLNGTPILDAISAEDMEIAANRLLKRARLVVAGLLPITAI